MAVELLFTQPVAQNPSTGIQRDRIGPTGADRSDGAHPFFNALERAAQSRNPAHRREHAAESNSTQPSTAVGSGKKDEPLDHETSAADASVQTESDEHPDPTTAEWNLTAFFKLLENLGFKDATETAGLQTMANASPADGDPMAAIESQMARLQQHQSGQAADLKFDTELLQQIIGAVERTGDGFSVKGFSPGLANELAQLRQWLNGLLPGIPGQKAISDFLTGPPAAGVVNGASVMAAESEGSAGSALKSPVMNGNISGLASGTAAEAAGVLPQPEARSDAESILSTESRSPAGQKDQDSKASPGIVTPELEAAKTKAALGAGREPRAATHSDTPGRVPLAAAPDHPVRQGPDHPVRQGQPEPDKPTVKTGASPGPMAVAAKMSDSQTQSGSDSVPLSKVFQETQLVKDGGLKAASNATEEAVGKIIKTEKAETGNPDNGLLNSSGQNLQKAAQPVAVQQESQGDQSALRNQTLDQIVHKAAIHLKNGRHEAQIDLKPDFLGHIRMQVISADHQVTVKILAQHGFVKDMIESNIHQLKADLNQQGLEVDKLEVTVSRDSEDSGNNKDRMAQARARPDQADRQNGDRGAKEKKRQSTAPARAPDGQATVDYFA